MSDTGNKAFVIHVRDMKDFPDAVYIGRAMPRQRLRASKWANPFRVEDHGRAGAIDRYVKHMDETEAMKDIDELVGKPLACWCRHYGDAVTGDNLCHGDVLAAAANALDKKP